jgi:hypothetical protein
LSLDTALQPAEAPRLLHKQSKVGTQYLRSQTGNQSCRLLLAGDVAAKSIFTSGFG